MGGREESTSSSSQPTYVSQLGPGLSELKKNYQGEDELGNDRYAKYDNMT